MDIYGLTEQEEERMEKEDRRTLGCVFMLCWVIALIYGVLHLIKWEIAHLLG